MCLEHNSVSIQQANKLNLANIIARCSPTLRFNHVFQLCTFSLTYRNSCCCCCCCSCWPYKVFIVAYNVKKIAPWTETLAVREACADNCGCKSAWSIRTDFHHAWFWHTDVVKYMCSHCKRQALVVLHITGYFQYLKMLTSRHRQEVTASALIGKTNYTISIFHV